MGHKHRENCICANCLSDDGSPAEQAGQVESWQKKQTRKAWMMPEGDLNERPGRPSQQVEQENVRMVSGFRLERIQGLRVAVCPHGTGEGGFCKVCNAIIPGWNDSPPEQQEQEGEEQYPQEITCFPLSVVKRQYGDFCIAPFRFSKDAEWYLSNMRAVRKVCKERDNLEARCDRYAGALGEIRDFKHNEGYGSKADILLQRAKAIARTALTDQPDSKEEE